MDNNYIQRREHDEYVKRMDDEHRRINYRLKKCEEISKQIQDININISNLAGNMKQLLDEQLEQGKRLDKIEDEPNKTLGALKNSIINAIGTAIGGAIIVGIAYLVKI